MAALEDEGDRRLGCFRDRRSESLPLHLSALAGKDRTGGTRRNGE